MGKLGCHREGWGEQTGGDGKEGEGHGDVHNVQDAKGSHGASWGRGWGWEEPRVAGRADGRRVCMHRRG
jgi:hypothetical protein